MAEFTEIDRQLLQETHKAVIELKVVLLGVNSDKGLIGKVNELSASQNCLKERHNKLSKTVWMLIGILVGSGILTGSLWTLLH